MEENNEITISTLAEDAEELETKQSLVITAKQLVNFKYPETKWIVKDLIPAVGLTAITGAPYSYKSFITQYLALCIATNQPLFNHFEVTEGTILMIDKENAKSLIKDRLIKLGFKDNPPIYFLNNPEKYDLTDPQTLAWTIEFVKTHLVSLIILDSFVHIHRGEENDSQSIARTFETLKQIPCPIVFIHHHRKTLRFDMNIPILESIRGSSDIGAELESHLAVDSMSDGTLRITQGKNRWGMLIKPFKVSPLITENTAIFEYGGEISEEMSKIQMADTLLINILSDNIEHSRKQLLEASISEGIGRDSMDQAIKKRESEKQLKIRFEGKSKLISLSPDISPDSGDETFSVSQQSYLRLADSIS